MKLDFKKIYSFSKLELFKKCPYQYYLSYLDPKIAPLKEKFKKPRDYKTKGQAVHGAITLFYYLSKEERNFKNLKKCLKKAWYSEIFPEKEPPLGEWGGFFNLAHERRVYQESLLLLKNFYNLAQKDPQIFYLPTKDIKRSFSDYKDLIVPLEKGYYISGKFDQINEIEGGLQIIDYKTGRSGGEEFQLKFYKILAELNFKRKVNLATFYYLNKKEMKNLPLNFYQDEKIKEEILERIREIEKTKYFIPKPGKICHHCDFSEICPYFKFKD